ncbi:MAG: 1-acylglycerol-3-phosphate O-acyltransferase [Deltaproteobacteria bacterium]|nr:1-acylglycerol-3-phosphate O-acyltransferase [Deltaproteobacteria bacterium]NIS76837.1 1-acylglycerol-3-phosphate O-acyltransferase [Deltaproteobacteria bacterium]
MILVTCVQALLIAFYTLVIGSAIVLLVLIVRIPGIQNTAYSLSKIYCVLSLKTCFVKLRVKGIENIDPNGQYVFMSNHVSYFDIPAVAMALPNQMRWVYKKELAKVPFFGWAVKSIGHILVDRGNRSQAIESLKNSLSRLSGNASIMIFPEGTRSKSGDLLPLKKGGFHIALHSGFPIVPVAIRGSGDIMRKGTFRINPGTIEVEIFSPIETDGYGTGRIHELVERVQKVMQEGVNREAAQSNPSRE